MIRQTTDNSMTNRQAIRCLWDNAWGTLSVFDHTTGRTHNKRVRYQPTRDGAFETHVSDAPKLLHAIRNGGAVSLEVDDAVAFDEPGVTAWVNARVVDAIDATIGRASQPLIKLRLTIKRLAANHRENVAA